MAWRMGYIMAVLQCLGDEKLLHPEIEELHWRVSMCIEL
jgi:hypothetical protein